MKNTVKRAVLFVLMLIMAFVCVFSLAACDGNKDGTYRFKDDTRFYVDAKRTGLMGYGGIVYNILESIAIDKENTYIEFKKDGTMHFQLRTSTGLLGEKLDDLLAFAREYLKISFTKDEIGEMLSTFDIETAIDMNVEPMFPGFKAKLRTGDLDGALKLLQRSLGFYLYGLDYENETIKQLLREIGENMTVPADIFDRIPSDTVLTLTFDNTYYIKDVVGHDGNQYTAIYISDIGKHSDQTQTWGVFDVTENENHKKQLYIRAEFMNMRIGFLEA